MITVNQEKVLEKQIAVIEAKYEAKFASLKDRLMVVIAADGVTQDPNTAAIRTEWQAAADEKEAEIMALLGGM